MRLPLAPACYLMNNASTWSRKPAIAIAISMLARLSALLSLFLSILVTAFLLSDFLIVLYIFFDVLSSVLDVSAKKLSPCQQIAGMGFY